MATKKSAKICYLGFANLPSYGHCNVFLIGGNWKRAHHITGLQIAICNQNKITMDPNKATADFIRSEGEIIVEEVTVEGDRTIGAFTNNIGVPTVIKKLIRTNTNRLFSG